jgi:acyl-CoA thioesterase
LNDTTTLTDAQLARLREAAARIPYVRLLGIELVSAERGAATLRLAVREELTRMEGIMHGGAIASLLDTASAFAVITTLEPGQTTVTVDLTIHYLRPVLQGRLTAHARVLRAGRRIVVITVDATDDAGELISTALTTYMKKG